MCANGQGNQVFIISKQALNDVKHLLFNTPDDKSTNVLRFECSLLNQNTRGPH